MIKRLTLVLMVMTGIGCRPDPNDAMKDLGFPVPVFVKIPAGEFVMGDDSIPASAPSHRVRLSEFWMSETEITVGQFTSFVEATGYVTETEKSGGGWINVDGKFVRTADASWKNPYQPNFSDYPVVLVTRADAEAYCAWLSERSGLSVKLPTEAQWEFACGTSPDDTSSAWTVENSGRQRQTVKSKRPAAHGLYDMLGNVWEWTRDFYSDYSDTAGIDPVQTRDLARGGVMRGGSFQFPKSFATPAFRQEGHGAHARAQDLGFRVVVR